MDAMSYSAMWHDRLKGRWFLIRLRGRVEVSIQDDIQSVIVSSNRTFDLRMVLLLLVSNV